MDSTAFSPLRFLREVALYLGASPLSLWHQLDELRALDDHLLRDIGVSRSQAIRGGPKDAEDHTMLLFATGSLSRGV